VDTMELRNPDWDVLLKAAQSVLDNAYAPYSGIRVAAAVMTGSGQSYTGCNIENSSFSLTICAERSALFHALAHGEKKFLAMAVVTDSERVTSPCGSCRQVLAEFAIEMTVIFSNPQETKLFTVAQLLPHTFTLKHDA